MTIVCWQHRNAQVYQVQQCSMKKTVLLTSVQSLNRICWHGGSQWRLLHITITLPKPNVTRSALPPKPKGFFCDPC